APSRRAGRERRGARPGPHGRAAGAARRSSEAVSGWNRPPPELQPCPGLLVSGKAPPSDGNGVILCRERRRSNSGPRTGQKNVHHPDRAAVRFRDVRRFSLPCRRSIGCILPIWPAPAWRSEVLVRTLVALSGRSQQQRFGRLLEDQQSLVTSLERAGDLWARLAGERFDFLVISRDALPNPAVGSISAI